MDVLQVVLVAPEIAPNTGNIIRLCANAGATLHLVEPLGFRLDDRALARAGLDYHELTTVQVHSDLPTAMIALDTSLAGSYALSGRGTVRYDAVRYRLGDVVIFGAERAGLAPDVLDAVPAQRRLRIPMRAPSRSLNLANAAAVVLYEAWRQHDFDGADDTGANATLAETPGGSSFDPPSGAPPG